MNKKLSVAILAKNAEKHLALCLKSVEWADEIIVLDGHSTDSTRDIATKFGAIVLEKDFEGFPAERQYVIDHAKNDWILSLDTDMIVPSVLADEIQDLLRMGPEYDAYLMRCLNHF
ncbi:MAG TPA: glycosyltransferase, partial [Alphaproteobacteria bacterium]|nr:glycosyltransferase [Alphaproteobacteria bacterium]